MSSSLISTAQYNHNNENKCRVSGVITTRYGVLDKWALGQREMVQWTLDHWVMSQWIMSQWIMSQWVVDQ